MKLKDSLVAAGYLPELRAEEVDAEFSLRHMRSAVSWYAVPGHHRFTEADQRHEHERSQPDPEHRAAIKRQVDQFALPPESVLIRRMQGFVAIVLQTLRAGADWGAIAAEYLHGEPPATSLGQQEAEFLAGRRGARGLRSGQPGVDQRHPGG